MIILQVNYTESITQALKTSLGPLAGIFLQPQMLGFFALFGIVFLLNTFNGGHRRGILTTGRWAGATEKLAALKTARRQLRSSEINEVVLWCGSLKKWQMKGILPQLITFLTGHPPTLFLPNANQSFAVIGRANSGKTFSVINPLCVSAIQQRMPLVLYDYKADDQGEGGQLSYLASFAARHGYDVRIFSPGRDYTCIINPLDFLSDENDDTTAAVLAEVFHKNLKRDTGKGDAFFGPAGQRLIQSLMQFAKATQYPDLAMAFSVLQLDNLPKRLAIAAQAGNLPPFVKVGFAQLIAATESEKTTASIISTAADVLTRFMSPRVLPALMGQTNVPLLLGEKQMLVFQSDIFRQDVLNPLIAAVINIVMQKNFSIQRTVPIAFCGDEFPTIFIPKSPTWANEHRSKGFIGIYGFQSLAQLKESYGNERSDILLSGLGSQFWFNPNHYNTAEEWQKSLGEVEVWVKSKSLSRSGGTSGGGRSSNEQIHKKPLISTDQILGFRQGECILKSPALQGRRRSGLPWHIKRINIPKTDQEIAQQCEAFWQARLKPVLTEREQSQRPPIDMEQALALRTKEAERLLPLSKEPKDSVPYIPMPEAPF
jgi:type IV secretory pathway TraG/TraD family ATPase VirD4